MRATAAARAGMAVWNLRSSWPSELRETRIMTMQATIAGIMTSKPTVVLE